MTSFVLDASLALAWHFPDEASSRANAIASLSDVATIVLPSHWFAEIANGMLVGERRRRTTSEERVRFIDRIKLLDVDVDGPDPNRMFDVILPLARAHGLTIYDTLYLELAERRGLPLASLDDELNAAARRVGIELVEETA
jgi:predicted nucleic acid-binding protein